MSHETKQTITQYIPLATMILGLAVSWGTFTTKLNAEEQIIASQDQRIIVLERTLTELRIDTASIKSDVSFIKSRVQ